jgi:hypothetical protein
MQKRHRLAFTALSLITLGACAASVEKPEIFVDQAGALQVPRAIQVALESSFPGFRHWQASDYHEGLRVGTAPAGGHGVIAPYALVLDLNADGRDDLVLDGHDQHSSLLLCVISSKAGYSVQVLNQGRPIPVPAARESWKDGRRGVGLNKVLSMPPANRKDWVFVINYLPETWMHPLPPAAEDYAEGVGIMFTHGHCAVDDRGVEPDVH